MFSERDSEVAIHYFKYTEEEPYMALFLKEVNHNTIDRQRLRLPLIAACSISKHIRLVLPMSRSASPIVDDVFNELFKYQSQINPQAFKDFVVRSKGILYANDTTTEEEGHILRCAKFLMTTDVGIWRSALDMRLPSVFISQYENKKAEIMISSCESIEGSRLRDCIALALEKLHIEKIVSETSYEFSTST
jgi:hypothetical protein